MTNALIAGVQVFFVIIVASMVIYVLTLPGVLKILLSGCSIIADMAGSQLCVDSGS